MVMGRDSRSVGRGIDSWYRILDGHLFTYICCKNCIVCLKRPKIHEKEAVVGPFKKNKDGKKSSHCVVQLAERSQPPIRAVHWQVAQIGSTVCFLDN